MDDFALEHCTPDQTLRLWRHRPDRFQRFKTLSIQIVMGGETYDSPVVAKHEPECCSAQFNRSPDDDVEDWLYAGRRTADDLKNCWSPVGKIAPPDATPR